MSGRAVAGPEAEAGERRDTAGAYWPSVWSCEDGGPRRWGSAAGQAGPGIRPGEGLRVAAARDCFAADMLIRREPGELFALRHRMPLGDPLRRPTDTWVERLDPETLEPLGRTPSLPGGTYWPGGIAAHEDGDLHMVFGAWAHRITPGLEVLASHRLPVDRPHNSFVLLDTGELVTKDCDAPEGLAPSTVSVLDPETLLPVAAPLRLPEPCVARLACDGERVVAVGSETVFGLRLDRGAARLEVEEWRPRYELGPEQSYGWDPVITDEHVLWMDNGRNRTDRTMRDTGVAPGPVRLWWARRDDPGAVRSVEISGLPYGTESNPPAWDPRSGVVVAYDAGNAVLRAWRLAGEEMEPLWRRDGFAHAGHLIVYPDTRELVVQDWRDTALLRRRPLRGALKPAFQLLGNSERARRASLRGGADQLVVLDLDSGEERGRVGVPSPSQAFLFPAPGFGRDIYYLSLTTIARVEVC